MPIQPRTRRPKSNGQRDHVVPTPAPAAASRLHRLRKRDLGRICVKPLPVAVLERQANWLAFRRRGIVQVHEGD